MWLKWLCLQQSKNCNNNIKNPFAYLCHILEVLVTFLERLCPLQVLAYGRVLGDEGLAVVSQPVQYLLDVLLEEAQTETLM